MWMVDFTSEDCKYIQIKMRDVGTHSRASYPKHPKFSL